MKIALVGYGKMGHMLEQSAVAFGHSVVATIDPFAPDAGIKIPSGDSRALADAVVSSGAEGIIEFTHPSSVMENIKVLLPLKIPMVVGTTGWNEKKQEVASLAQECGGTIMTTANFSIGVAILYKIVEEASRLVNNFSEYDAAIWEMHHNQKADSPSGTALEIANHLLSEFKRKDSIVTDEFKERPKPNQLHVSSTRCGSVPGTHKVFFDCEADTIEISHTARSRHGLANGAVHALENLCAMLKSGELSAGALYGMNDVFPQLFKA
ncbi:4-hydroxy-tetrahydrodipicolinate reductase [Treponema sp.]|uniref:4-hydroxy-tetrahydrodipicolinate reductase n=1 Tax=Treponema sp. TaxID=166 RepID=UPI003EFBF2F1